MPASKTSLAITRRYQNGMGALRRRAQAEARETWKQISSKDLSGTYQVGMLTLRVTTLQREAAHLSTAYITAFVSSELGHPTEVPMTQAWQVGKARNGDDLRKQLMSPLIGVKVGIRDGKDVGAAMAEGGRALERLVGLATDTAAREALRLALAHSPYVLGWRRAVKGTCGACMGAATGDMHPADGQLDIHPNCECVAEPVVKAEPYSPKKGERVEVQNGLEFVGGKWVRVVDPVRGTVQKLDAKQVMINAGTAKKPRWITATRENVYKPVKAVAQKVDDLPHSLNPYEQVLTDKEIKAFDSYKGYGYRQINGALRAGKPGGPTADILDGALKKGSIGQDTTLYRFMHLPEGARGVGDIFVDKAFSSTALKRAALQRGKTGKVLMRIKAKAGQNGGFIRGQHEEEFLLPRDTRFKIIKETRESDGRRVFDVEILK